MTKIAVLMLIHRNDEQTFRLIKHLSKNFDVYVHIDKKSAVNTEDYSIENVFAYKELKVYWGGHTQILAVHYLLEKAFNKKYDRYILISGQDLPIKSNQQIADFFEKNNAEYISIEEKVTVGSRQKGGLDRVTKYWPNWLHRGKNPVMKVLFGFQYGLFMIFSTIKPRPVDYEFYKGPNWVNLTHKCVEKIVEYLKNNPTYINRFKWTNCADELFYQTIVAQLNGLEVVNDCLRYIDWSTTEYPKTLRKEDYEKIANSNNLFARKFDTNKDKEIIEMIYEKVK